MADDHTRTLVAEIAARLEATEELPVDRTAARWIGEAQAVTTDLAENDPDRDTVERRIGHVVELLDNVERTDHPEADEHVAAATSLAVDLLETLD
jgi:hypothetical protein